MFKRRISLCRCSCSSPLQFGQDTYSILAISAPFILDIGTTAANEHLLVWDDISCEYTLSNKGHQCERFLPASDGKWSFLCDLLERFYRATASCMLHWYWVVVVSALSCLPVVINGNYYMYICFDFSLTHVDANSPESTTASYNPVRHLESCNILRCIFLIWSVCIS